MPRAGCNKRKNYSANHSTLFLPPHARAHDHSLSSSQCARRAVVKGPLVVILSFSSSLTSPLPPTKMESPGKRKKRMKKGKRTNQKPRVKKKKYIYKCYRYLSVRHIRGCASSGPPAHPSLAYDIPCAEWIEKSLPARPALSSYPCLFQPASGLSCPTSRLPKSLRLQQDVERKERQRVHVNMGLSDTSSLCSPSHRPLGNHASLTSRFTATVG